MKIAVMSYSGSVGKTVVAHHLLKARMPEAVFKSVETINQSAADLGASDVEQLKGRDFKTLLQSILLEDEAIIDVGMSNIEAMMEAMELVEGAAHEFDMFVIPITPDQKAWQEGLKTADVLSAMGVSADKIRLLPNKIEKSPVDEIPTAYNYVKRHKRAWISEHAYLFNSDVYGYLAHKKMGFSELTNPEVDYKALAKAEPDKEKAKELAGLYVWSKMAVSVKRNQDYAFEKLFAKG
jgi:hypothetical protein